MIRQDNAWAKWLRTWVTLGCVPLIASGAFACHDWTKEVELPSQLFVIGPESKEHLERFRVITNSNRYTLHLELAMAAGVSPRLELRWAEGDEEHRVWTAAATPNEITTLRVDPQIECPSAATNEACEDTLEVSATTDEPLETNIAGKLSISIETSQIYVSERTYFSVEPLD